MCSICCDGQWSNASVALQERRVVLVRIRPLIGPRVEHVPDERSLLAFQLRDPLILLAEFLEETRSPIHCEGIQIQRDVHPSVEMLCEADQHEQDSGNFSKASAL